MNAFSQLPPSGLDGLRLHRARTEMERFVSWTKADYVWGWHQRVLCKYLDRLTRRAIRKLMVLMPPRHGKSELVSRRLPAHFLGLEPDSPVILVSYAADLASRMNRDCQRVMDDPSYARLYPETRLAPRGASVRQGQRAVRTDSLFEVVGRGGSLRTAGFRGGITGMGFRLGIIDDAYKNAEEAMSVTIRDKVYEEYRSSFLTRQAPDASILLTGTPWHHDDLYGTLQREEPGEWEVLRFPAISQDDRHVEDERIGPGEALWPDRFDLPWLERMQRSLGSLWWSALYQCEPTPEGGNLFRRSWFGRYRSEGEFWLIAGRGPAHKPDCTVFAAVDPAASEKQSADYTAIVVGAMTRTNDLLILDVIRERMTPDRIPKRMQEVARQWDPQFFVFEDNGFQVAVSRQARKLEGMPPIREVRPHGKGKVVRATPAIVKAEAGQVFVPEPAPEWLGPFFDELERFRGEDETNDQVDAFADLVNQSRRLGITGPETEADEIERRVLPRPERDGAAQRRGLWGRT